jgi:hypothetical protein
MKIYLEVTLLRIVAIQRRELMRQIVTRLGVIPESREMDLVLVS